jgi:hypothetical protein
MKNAITTAVLATLLSLPMLTGCNKEKVAASSAPDSPTAPTAPTAPDKPVAPDAPVAVKDQASVTVPGANADAIEAKAGDVSVKLPN